MNKTTMTDPMGSTKEERKQKLEEMNRLTTLFYAGAVKIGVHSFIEFTGLMNEYISACRTMEAAGDGSWDHANTHSDSPMTLKPYHIQYLTEKLDCIYGPSLRADPFLQAILTGKDPQQAVDEA
jgi:hypothetical protein